MIRDIERSFASEPNEDPEFSPVYSQQLDTMHIPIISKQESVHQIDNVSINIATNILKSLNYRLKPYLSYYHAIEIIDSTALVIRPSNQIWAKVKSISIRYDLDYDMVRKKILEIGDDSIESSVMDIYSCIKEQLRVHVAIAPMPPLHLHHR